MTVADAASSVSPQPTECASAGRCNRCDGVLIGDHRVTITTVALIESEKAKAIDEKFGSLLTDMPILPPKKPSRVPRSYSGAGISALEFEVEHGMNKADFA